MSNQPDSPVPAPRATPAAAHPATPFAPAVAPPRAPDPRSPSLTPDADLPVPPPHITEDQRARLDAHGFDPADYDWEPVNKRVRHDGWTVERQRAFIATLADTGSVREAAATAGMSVVSAYALRRAPGAAGFNRAWAMALQSASQILADVAYERALYGDDDPVYDEAGHVVHIRKKRSERLLMFLLRAHQPHIYGNRTAPPPQPEPESAPHRWDHDESPFPWVEAALSKTTVEPLDDEDEDDDRPTLPRPEPSPLPGLIAAPDLAGALDALGPVAPADPLAAMDSVSREELALRLEDEADFRRRYPNAK